jgi:hypothetical protein
MGKETKKFRPEEKPQKTLARLSRPAPAAYAESQEYFGSFFQNRTFLPA